MYRVCKHWLRDKIPSPRAQWDSIIITQYFAIDPKLRAASSVSNQCECTHHLCDWRNWKNPPASSVVTELWGLSRVSTRASVGHAEPQSATGKSNQCSKSFGGSWAPYCNDGGQITKTREDRFEPNFMKSEDDLGVGCVEVLDETIFFFKPRR